MRKLKSNNYFIILILFAITSCKLDPVIYPVNNGIYIKYQITLSNKCNCEITYADSLNYNVTDPLTEKTWEKTFKVKNKDYFKTAYLRIASDNLTSQTSGTANIYVNGVLKATTNFASIPTTSAPTVSYKVKK